MPEPPPNGVPTYDADARRRYLAILRGMAAPFVRVITRMAIGVALAVAVAAGIIAATHDPAVGFVAGLAVATAFAVVVWWPLTDPAFRAATEVFYDHNCHERDEWRKETGTSMPSTIRGAERWIKQNPTSKGRASILTFLGRLDEAEHALSAIEPHGVEEAFELEIARGHLAIARGQFPDSAALHASWATLPAGRQRRHLRECLALLDSQLAVARGADPLPALVAARRDIDEVYWTMRTPWLLARWSGFATLAVGIAAFIGALVTGAWSGPLP